MKTTSLLVTWILVTTTPLAFAQEEPIPEESLVVTSAADLFARDSYRIDTIICPFKGSIDYQPGDIECGLLEVPENREDPDSRFIELHFVKLNSRWGKDEEEEKEEDESDKYAEGLAEGKREDPVVYLTGGPGAPVTYYVGRFKDHTLLDHRDLYILEQRGIGSSDDFCPFYGARNASDLTTFQQNLEAASKDVAYCASNARAGSVDLTGYNSVENARDVKALRRALGFEQWNVWGISYGSILGQAYAKEDPEGILAMALDAIMPLSIADSDDYWRVVHWYDRDLKKLQEICDRQPDCASHYPDIGGRLRSAVQSMVDNPIVVEVKDTELYPSGKAYFFQDIVAFLPFLFFYEQDNYPGIPGLVYAWADAVERRDETLFKALASASGGGFGDSSDGMRNAIMCNDGGIASLERAGNQDMADYPVLGNAINTAESLARATALCSELGMPMRPGEDFLPTRTDVPALIIEGDMDPITPPPNAKAILPGFSNGTYVEFPFAGHGPSRSVKCAGHMLNKFYDNPTAQPDISCVESMEEPQIYAPLYETNIGPRLMAVYGEDKKKLAGPGLWAGGSILILLISFLVLTFAPLVRRMEKRQAAPAGRVRLYAWLSATVSLLSVGIIGGAFAVTADASEMLVGFGLVPWAKYGAWMGVVAGLLGLATILSGLKIKRRESLPVGTLLGFVLTGAAAMGLSSFLLMWGLGPF
jgi:pimeloyl-ACP methyl ester carboxylesterase